MEVIGIRQDSFDDVTSNPKLDFSDVSDPRLQRAMSVAMETKQITPLLKEELRLSILTRRLAAGQDEINATFPQPKSYNLTPAEMEKRERRKLQNKIAARRHRRKSKSKTMELLQELEKQKQIKVSLEQEFARLTNEKQEVIAKLLSQHNGIAVSCDLCENEAGCEPIQMLLNVSGTISVESSVFTVIQWEGFSCPDPQYPPTVDTPAPQTPPLHTPPLQTPPSQTPPFHVTSDFESAASHSTEED